MNNIEELREHCEEMIAISPLRYAYIPASSIITLIDRIEKAEAALSAANEKLSKPVVLPDYRCSPDMHTKQYYETIGFNLGLDACKAVIKTAGFTVEGNADGK